MTYSTPHKCIVRLIAPNVAIALCPFKGLGVFNFGARMSLIRHSEGVVAFAVVPFGQDTVDALASLAGADDEPLTVTHLVIPNTEHTMAAASFKEKYPNVKVISPEKIMVANVDIDYAFTAEKHGNRIIAGADLSEMGLPISIVQDFEFVYLPYHGNRELILYNKVSKVMFEADLLFNLGHRHLEQYSLEVGFKDLFNPHFGLSFFTRYLSPTSMIGNGLLRKICNVSQSLPGLKAVYLWDTQAIVPCHGDVFTENVKALFKKTYPDVEK